MPIDLDYQFLQLLTLAPIILSTLYIPITSNKSQTYFFLLDITDQSSSLIKKLKIIEYIQWYINSKKFIKNIKQGFIAIKNILKK